MKGDVGHVIRNGKRIETVTTYDPLDHVKPKKSRSQQFGRLTYERLKSLSKVSAAAVKIYCYLLIVNWKDLDRSVKLTNKILAEIGVSPDAKSRALPQLEREGLIRIDEHSNCRAPTVTPLK